MVYIENEISITADKCEVCDNHSDNPVYCIKCGRFACGKCIEGYFSDWECACIECGW